MEIGIWWYMIDSVFIYWHLYLLANFPVNKLKFYFPPAVSSPTCKCINMLYLSLSSRGGSVQARFLFWMSIRPVMVSEVASDICVTLKTYLIVPRRDRWLTRLSYTTPLPSVPPTFMGTGKFLGLQTKRVSLEIHFVITSACFRDVIMSGMLES